MVTDVKTLWDTEVQNRIYNSEWFVRDVIPEIFNHWNHDKKLCLDCEYWFSKLSEEQRTELKQRYMGVRLG